MNHDVSISQSWEAVFAELPYDAFEDFKKIEISVQLGALLSYAGKTRSEVASLMGVSKGRITALLSGDCNPTLKTVHDFCRALGYDFDLFFRVPAESPCAQPWDELEVLPVLMDPQPRINLVAQSMEEVLADINMGIEKPIYVSPSVAQSSVNRIDDSNLLQVARVVKSNQRSKKFDMEYIDVY